MKNGTTFYDERNNRYMTTDGQGANPKVWSCIVEEMNEAGEYEIIGRQLFNEAELMKFKRV